MRTKEVISKLLLRSIFRQRLSRLRGRRGYWLGVGASYWWSGQVWLVRQWDNYLKNKNDQVYLSTKAILREGRVYGGGLHKLEPNELGNVDATPIMKAVPELKDLVKTIQPSLFDLEAVQRNASWQATHSMPPIQITSPQALRQSGDVHIFISFLLPTDNTSKKIKIQILLCWIPWDRRYMQLNVKKCYNDWKWKRYLYTLIPR